MIKKVLKKFRKKSLTVDEALQRKINPHDSDKRDKITRESLIAGLIIIAIVILVIWGTYIGYVTYHQGQGGYIYELNLVFKRPTFTWAAVYGAAFGVGINQPWEFNITPGTLSEENIFFDCFETGIEHEIYASLVPQNQLDTNSLQPATVAEIDAFIGINSTNYQSAYYTYTTTMTVNYGTNSIVSVPATYTYSGSGSNVTSFIVGALKDGNGNYVFVAKVYADGLTRGFNDRYYNYQLLLPMRHNETTYYYLWSDPNDICIGGDNEPEIVGLVQGNVTDTSGNPIESAIIVVGKYSTVTNYVGFYNTTAVAGEQRIMAIKEGYKVYQNLINVTQNNITYHNIVLEVETEPNDFTNIGPDYRSGEDAAGTNTDVGPGQVPFQIETPTVIEGQDYVIPITRIYRRLRVGEFSQESVIIQSFKTSSVEVQFNLGGNVSNLTALDNANVRVPPRSDASMTMTFFANETPGVYNGSLNITGNGINAIIPVEIEIVDKDKLPIQTLLLDLTAPDKTLYAGSTFSFRTDLTNLLSDLEYPVELFYTLQNMDGTETIWAHKTNVYLKTSLSIIKNVELPPDMPIGDYVLRVTAKYLDLSASSSLVFPVELPFYETIIFGGIRVWHAFLIFLFIGLLTLLGFWLKKNMEAKKKYHLKFEQNQLPKEGPRNIKVGKIAETNIPAYMNLENFKTHTIDAGSTGGGKSFSAQVIIEEMLLKDIAVIVFDPTAQWTGMLRKLTNKGLLALYPNYGLKPQDAQAFKGNIRQINNARELIDIKKYMKPGEIQVFAVHKLDPKEIDIFVANTVRQVFHENFDESEPLRLMLVYDEVHRLLPKFGGSGEGFLQIERACREFRKWGIGVMLISQVLADFVGQIKANINTEVQMRTRDEGDLDRIKTKYGDDVLKSLVKASVGTGMIQNAAYNRGRPYFVTFRPIMHSVARLTDEEIEQYNLFNEQIDQVTYELGQLEELKQDVFDLRLELKLALDKVKAGNFNMAKIYTEGITPRITKLWDKLGKTPKKLEKKMVSEEELKAELEKAKKDHDEAKSKEIKSGGEAKSQSDKPEDKFKKDVPPDKILHLHNDMLVVSPKTLSTELEAMKDSDYEAHVSATKNDFSDWLKNSVGDTELGDLVAQETDKAKIISLLRLREEGKKLPKLEIKKKTTQDKAELQNTYLQSAEKKLEEEKANAQEEKKAFEELSKDPERPQDNNKPEQNKENKENKETDNETEVIADKENEKKLEEKTIEDKKPEFIEENKPSIDKKVEENMAVKSEVSNESKEQSKEQSEKKEDNTSHINIEKNAPEDKYFKLENGVELKSIKELKEYLPSMPDEVFKSHVSEDKNDFASWIEGVFHEGDLASQIKQVTSKNGLEEVLANA